MRHWIGIFGFSIAFLVVAGVLVWTISLLGTAFSDHWTLSFQAAQSNWRLLGLTLLAGGCVAAMVSLFRDERQLVPRNLALTLLTLRCGLVLVIFLAMLEPVWTWSYQKNQLGHLLIALDVSDSMETVDLQATELEKLRWGDALGVFGSTEAQTRAQQWISDLEAGREPKWISEAEAADPKKGHQLAEVREQNLKSQLQETASLSRLEILRRAITSSPSIKAIERTCRIEFAGLADEVIPFQEKILEKPLTEHELPLDRQQSRFTTLVDAIHQSSTPAPLSGIILLSDGHDTTNIPADKLTQRLQGLGIPIYTVLIGSENRPRDLSVLHVDHPESVFLKDQPKIKAILQTTGFEGEALTVSLQSLDSTSTGELPSLPITQTITPTEGATEVEFTLPEQEIGRHRFRLWVDVAPNETRDDNNSADFAYNVVDDRARVLVIDGESRWEFRFLNDALSRDPQVSLDTVLFNQPYLGVLSKPFFPNKIADAPANTTRQTRFSTYDVVLIGDVSPKDVQSEHWQDLDRYVRDEGGTLVLTAGKQFVPFAYQGTLAENLLPIEHAKVVELNAANQIGPPESRGFRLLITPDGEQLPMFQLTPEREESRRIWNQLPGQLWGVVGQVRGGASVWAAGLPPGSKPTLETERENAIIAQHYVGSGQVVWIGLDSTWRWRYLVGDLYHHRFWGQLVRWAVSFKAAAGNESVRLRLQNSVIKQGEPALIQVRLDERFLAQAPDATLQAVITRQGEGRPYSQSVPLQPRDGNPVLKEAVVNQLPAGEYKIQLQLSGAETPKPLPEVVLIVNAELTKERQDVHANRPLLEQIAATTGGTFLQINELNRLPEFFRQSSHTEAVNEEIPLYGHWVILVLFCGIAMTEWVLRKVNGLP